MYIYIPIYKYICIYIQRERISSAAAGESEASSSTSISRAPEGIYLILDEKGIKSNFLAMKFTTQHVLD